MKRYLPLFCVCACMVVLLPFTGFKVAANSEEVNNLSQHTPNLISTISSPSSLQDRDWVEGFGNDIRSCEFVSADDGWAVSDQAIFHWNGQQWEDVLNPPMVNAYINQPETIRVNSSDDIWVAGNGGLIIHWNGSKWSDYSQHSSLFDFKGLSFYSRDLGFASGTDTFSTPERRLMLFWNGKEWKPVYFPAFDTPHTNPEIYTIQITSPKEGWAGSFYHLYRWNGEVWREYPLEKDLGEDIVDITAISALSTSDVWATGSAKEDFIIHWNGHVWEKVYQSEYMLSSIRMISPTEGWAVGFKQKIAGRDISQGGVILYWDGLQWSEVFKTDRYELHTVCSFDRDHTWVWGNGFDGTYLDRAKFSLIKRPSPTSTPTASPTVQPTASMTPTKIVAANTMPPMSQKQPVPEEFSVPWQLLGICAGLGIVIFLFVALRRKR